MLKGNDKLSEIVSRNEGSDLRQRYWLRICSGGYSLVSKEWNVNGEKVTIALKSSK